MASGGMDTLPHNGAVITLLAVTGLTHRQAYKDIFAITLIKTAGGVRGDRGVLPDWRGLGAGRAVPIEAGFGDAVRIADDAPVHAAVDQESANPGYPRAFAGRHAQHEMPWLFHCRRHCARSRQLADGTTPDPIGGPAARA